MDNLKIPFGFDGLFWAGPVVPSDAVLGPPKDMGVQSAWEEGGREPRGRAVTEHRGQTLWPQAGSGLAV